MASLRLRKQGRALEEARNIESSTITSHGIYIHILIPPQGAWDINIPSWLAIQKKKKETHGDLRLDERGAHGFNLTDRVIV